MQDFYLTFPYALIFYVVAAIEYAKRGFSSTIVECELAALILVLSSYISYGASKRGINKHYSYFVSLAQTVCAGVVTSVWGQRYLQTSTVMPDGALSGISALMTGFYLYNIATGGNRIRQKAD